ncbi:MAG: nucleoside kinase [Anaerolineaceae bacterium]|nr:nucleoside kinase [Anaerolineaceae bacterium]
MEDNRNMHFVEKRREKIEIYLPNGKIIAAKRGTSLVKILSLMKDWEGAPIVGAVVDGKLRELSYSIQRDCNVTPLNMSTSDGSKIYRRSLTFLLETAFNEIFPGAFLTIDHSVPNGGYFCIVKGREPLTKTEIDTLEEHMHELARQDIPIIKEKVPLEKAISYFSKKKYNDKLRLLKYRKKPYLVLYNLKDHKDYHHGYMVPSTGFLNVFKLIRSGDGFILQYPRRKTPSKLFQMPRYSKLLDIFKQYGSWLESLDIDSVASLNDAILNNTIREVILVSEALHEQKIAQIASIINEKRDTVKIVLIAGPTSSGKTTFSKRLAIQLLTHGISPFAFEMDNYFVEREKTPRDENGAYNFEAFDAIDSELMEEHLMQLLSGKEVTIPRFNFKTGKRETGDTIRINENQILVIEGIHGLNPKLLSDIDKSKKFRIYTSCLTQLNLDHYNRISTTDSRLIRRIVRDARTRGYSAKKTIQMWESVRRGEREFIFPHQENADEIFNSALVYELAALKPYVEPLLMQIPYGTVEFLEAKRLLAFLEWFLPINEELIPDNSILREFIGGSILNEFKLWKNSPIQ